MKKKIKFEKGSGNVYADLQIDDSREIQVRGLIGLHLLEVLNGKHLKQREISDLLGIKQAEVSHLLNGHFSRFTVDKLLEFLKRLDHKVTIKISPHKKGEPFQQVAFG